MLWNVKTIVKNIMTAVTVRRVNVVVATVGRAMRVRYA